MSWLRLYRCALKTRNSFFFCSSRRRHTRLQGDWSSDVCSSDLPPPPNYLLEPAMHPPGENPETERRWQRRFGVTHGIWGADDDVRGVEVLGVIPDPALDRVMGIVPRLRGRGPWKLVRDRGAFPP